MTQATSSTFGTALAERLERTAQTARWRNDPVAWVEERLGEHMWSKQAEIMRAVRNHKMVAVQSSHGVGKALDVATPLPTPTGWTTMGAVRVGDELVNEDGKPVTVVGKSDVQLRPTYRLTFDDRSELVASDEHLWQVVDIRHRPRSGVTDWRDHWAATVTKTTADLAAEPTFNGQLRWRVPTCRPIEGRSVNMPIPPYTLGAWLGDGHTFHAAITCGYEDSPETLGHIEAEGVTTRARPSGMRERSGCWGLLGMNGPLRDMGLLKNKHIPERVFRADVDTRLAVLQGLMDTDGFMSSGQSVGVDLCDERLAADLAALVETFGWKARTSTKPATLYGRVVGTVYRLQYRPDLPVFRLRRKAERLGQVVAQTSRHTVRTIVSIEQVETVPTQCVAVDSPSHLYLAGSSCIPTHNSVVASRIVGYYLDNFPVGQFICVTTAPTWSQIRAVLWRYIAQMHAKAELPGYVTQTAEWKIGAELVAFGRKPADTNNQGMQGVHAMVSGAAAGAEPGVVAIIDESSGVPDQIWNAIDSLCTTPQSRILAVGNPDQVSSRFYQVCTTEPGWHRIKVNSFDAPAFTGEWVPPDMGAGLVQREWVEDKQRRWGETSPLYRVKVLGEFADDDESVLIPRAWVLAAQERWREWQDERAASPVTIEPPGERVFGVDVAYMGEDKTAIVPLQGNVVNPDGGEKIETHAKLDTTQTAGIVAAKLRGAPASRAMVDVVGIGAGVYDQLSRDGWQVSSFNGARRTRRTDVTGSWKFANCRSASYWHLRELLDPSAGARLALPPDDDLMADLTTPRWEPRAGGVIMVEDKDKIRERLGNNRSPDLADALAMAAWAAAPQRGADEDYQAAHEHDEPLEHADAYDPREDHPPIPASGIAAWGHGDEDTWSSF